LFDHVLGVDLSNRSPELKVAYDLSTPFREPLVLYGFLAAVTTELEVCAGVLALSQRQTALVAKQAAEVAILSGGRLRLGVGAGINPVEAQSLDTDFSTRGARQEEQIRVLRRLWTEPCVDFDGRWHHIDRAGIAPLPEASVPVWLGGASNAAAARAVRLADGFIAVVHSNSQLDWLRDRGIKPSLREGQSLASMRSSTTRRTLLPTERWWSSCATSARRTSLSEPTPWTIRSTATCRRLRLS
jgi:probable F420-dependent oxidoreductase